MTISLDLYVSDFENGSPSPPIVLYWRTLTEDSLQTIIS